METLDEAVQEIEKLGKKCEKLQGDLQGKQLPHLIRFSSLVPITLKAYAPALLLL